MSKIKKKIKTTKPKKVWAPKAKKVKIPKPIKEKIIKRSQCIIEVGPIVLQFT